MNGEAQENISSRCLLVVHLSLDGSVNKWTNCRQHTVHILKIISCNLVVHRLPSFAVLFSSLLLLSSSSSSVHHRLFQSQKRSDVCPSFVSVETD